MFLELGGKSVHLILDDVADMGLAAAFAAIGTGVVAGQGCALTTRVLIPQARYDEGVEQIAAMMSTITVGDPADAATVMGPLITAAQRDRGEGYVQGAVDQGATIVCGGKRPADLDSGFFYEPITAERKSSAHRAQRLRPFNGGAPDQSLRKGWQV